MIYKAAQRSSIRNKAVIVAISALSFVAISTLPVTTSLTYAQVQEAGQGRQLLISPPTISLTVKPGDTSEGTVSFINDSNEDMEMEISVYDVIVQDNFGTPQILPGGTIENNKYSASSWIGVNTPRFTAGAKKRTNIQYYYQIPGNAGAGGHYAAIVFRPKPFTTTGGTGSAINMQLSSLVYFDVAGTITESATVKSFTAPGFSEYGPVSLKAEIINKGDTHIKPVGTFKVTDMLGKTITSKEVPAGNIFPGGISRIYEQTVGKKWMIGRYTATFMATYGRSNNLPLVATVAFWVFPWKVALLVVLLIAAAVLGYLYMKKNKKRNHQDNQEVHEDQSQTTT